MVRDVLIAGCCFIFDLINASNLALLPVKDAEVSVESTKGKGIKLP